MSNGVQIGGAVIIEDYAILGGICAIHQFTRIGAHAFIGSMANVTTDVIPYGSVVGNPARLAGLLTACSLLTRPHSLSALRM